MKKEDEQIFTDSEQTVQQKTMEFILKVVQNYYQVDESYFLKKTRRNEILFARQVAMYLIKKNTKLSLNSIGQKCGNKDHATVINAIKRVQGYIDVDKQLKKQVSDIQQIIKLKSSSALNGYKLNDVFYYIDLNEFTSLRFGEQKTILMSGFSEQELSIIQQVFNGLTESKKHTNTGIYILEKREENGEQRE